jgi:hypothetical protein
MTGQFVQQAVEHLSYLDTFSHQRVAVGVGHCSDIAGQNEMILELAAGVERNAQEPRKFLFTLLSATLDNICGNRKRGPNYLAPECHISRATHSNSDAMGIYRKRVRLLPHVKLLEVCHTV